jgi:hypothetical protein
MLLLGVNSAVRWQVVYAVVAERRGDWQATGQVDELDDNRCAELGCDDGRDCDGRSQPNQGMSKICTNCSSGAILSKEGSEKSAEIDRSVGEIC